MILVYALDVSKDYLYLEPFALTRWQRTGKRWERGQEDTREQVNY